MTNTTMIWCPQRRGMCHCKFSPMKEYAPEYKHENIICIDQLDLRNLVPKWSKKIPILLFTIAIFCIPGSGGQLRQKQEEIESKRAAFAVEGSNSCVSWCYSFPSPVLIWENITHGSLGFVVWGETYKDKNVPGNSAFFVACIYHMP